MREKLALTTALASFAAVTALGVGIAGAEQVSGVGSAQPSGPLHSAPAFPAATAPACANGVDDDGDGLIDLEDSGCAGGGESEETAAPSEGSEVKAPQPEPSAPGVVAGEPIGATGGGGEGVSRNEGIDAPTSGAGGGTAAPPATAGDQPHEAGVSGGSSYGDGGSPTASNPSITVAPFGPAPIGVPNFVIDSFEIPPFLLPIYQACGTEHGVPWEILASINKIETAFGTNLNVSSAGAMGWMQFIPSSWEMYGVDANGDGRKDPYNPVDAICAAASYLDAAGASENLYDAIFAYNHADWYVQEVLLYARAYGKLPADLVGSLTGLTEGAHFPVAADARYADDIATREALREATPQEREEYGNAAAVISSSPTRRGINIFAAKGAPVVAVNDGIVEKVGESKRLGRFVVRNRRLVVMPTGKEKRVPVDSENLRPRVYANPDRVSERRRKTAMTVDSAAVRGADGTIKVGSKVMAGTVLARIGDNDEGADPHLNFSIRPAGRGAPRIDPKPILDGWKLLEATAIYRAKGKSPFAVRLSGAGVLLLPKEALQRRVLADEQIELPECDRIEVRTGRIDRRLLATLAYLSEQNYRLTIASMLCGRYGSITTSGNISNHSFGNAVDIAAINGIPVLGNQGPGTITEELLRTVLRLQGTLTPDELISLQELGGPSFAMADHADHVHIGWSPVGALGEARFVQLLEPDQWERLIGRLGEIENPDVPTKPSKYALPDRKGKGERKGSSGGTSSD